MVGRVSTITGGGAPILTLIFSSANAEVARKACRITTPSISPNPFVAILTNLRLMKSLLFLQSTQEELGATLGPCQSRVNLAFLKYLNLNRIQSKIRLKHEARQPASTPARCSFPRRPDAGGSRRSSGHFRGDPGSAHSRRRGEEIQQPEPERDHAW